MRCNGITDRLSVNRAIYEKRNEQPRPYTHMTLCYFLVCINVYNKQLILCAVDDTNFVLRFKWLRVFRSLSQLLILSSFCMSTYRMKRRLGGHYKEELKEITFYTLKQYRKVKCQTILFKFQNQFKLSVYFF